MRHLARAFSIALVAGGVLVTGCMKEVEEEVDEPNQTSRDWIEGAYIKRGGTPVFFVFRRGDGNGEPDTFFGEIEQNDKMVRANGRFTVASDKLGTRLKLVLDGVEGGDDQPRASGASKGSETSPPLVQQAFSGTMHYLKIGQNETILVRGDTNGKTAHYKRVQSWCGTNGAKDCASRLQRTGLTCTDESVTCTAKHECACGR
jgi:hypothetical protein